MVVVALFFFIFFSISSSSSSFFPHAIVGIPQCDIALDELALNEFLSSMDVTRLAIP